MKIGSYNDASFIDSNEVRKNNNNKSNNKQEVNKNMSEKVQNSDKLEISSNININSIKDKIESGFYDKHTVLSEVAKRITNQLDSEI